ncbi:LacI family DNA-binding transcriptional regulator [Bifidobacterium imperatoris]|uniref:LacI family DNA-binding transcriptional regulator n=1 Tax=Bifidobacterium imperatoris TaxID=2020965 RepID=A0A2N5IRL1_9BIFI|nr:LacI family DNA-binding transcriptional regulator [Bifidobacterium imperatoris]PLS24591.1 LacI family transcriptional regulator [Bifidobacterium imperatoris]QSY58522.1 LacI family DNA-binding transcriptional regulator [Bifidobacterium imperatoris]
MNQHKATIHDVARIAGVSRATVSRYLNGRKWVSQDAAANIKAAIEQTGYVANSHARALVTGRAGSVAFLLGEPQKLLFEDPNFAALLRAVADELGKRGVSFILMTTDDQSEAKRNLAYLQAGHVDGVIQVAWHKDSSEMLNGLVQAGIPTVIAEQPSDETLPVGYVHVEDYGGARKACEYLHECGAKHIAMIAGPAGPSGTRDRMHGFLDTVATFDDDSNAASRIAHGDYSASSGEVAMAQLLDADPDIDGVFVSSDTMAVGAIKELRTRGLSVPDDIQIIGFDDSSAAMLADPPLTTIRQPFQAIGKHLVDQLMRIINGEQPVGVTLPTELVVRDSTR